MAAACNTFLRLLLLHVEGHLQLRGRGAKSAEGGFTVTDSQFGPEQLGTEMGVQMLYEMLHKLCVKLRLSLYFQIQT